MELTEKLLFNNSFGSVTDKRIILNYKSGTEELPIRSISSISYIHKRNYFIVIPTFIIALYLICFITIVGLADERLSGSEMFIALLFFLLILLILIANWIGHHNIQISVGGINRKPLKFEKSKSKEGHEFVEAIKAAVIK
jgi:hypothetical protein